MPRARRVAPHTACIVAALLLAGCAPDTARSNNGDITLNDFSCNACSVRVDSIAFLGHQDDTVSFRVDVLPARDSRGRFYLPDRAGGVVHVFGPDGRLMTTFGKRGRGPGELAGIRAIFVANHDTLLVVGSSVVHVVSPEYTHVREYKTSGGGLDEFASTLLDDGRILIDRASHQFAIVDTSGALGPSVKLLGIDTARCGECGERIYREAQPPGTIWSGPVNKYQVENHDLSGKLLRRLVREAPWFPQWGQKEIEANDASVEFGRHRFMGARHARDGLLWTHVTMIEHAEDLKNLDEDVPNQAARIWARMETKIEAIDPDSNQLLAGTTVRGLVFPLRGDYSAQLVVNESGDWMWKILRFAIERRK